MTLIVHVFQDCDGCQNINTKIDVLRGGAVGTPQGIRVSTPKGSTGWVVFDADTEHRRDFCPECVKAGRAK